MIIYDEVQGEEVPFSFPTKGGEEIRTSALVLLECLEDHLLHLLDENNLLVECVVSYTRVKICTSTGCHDSLGMTHCQRRRSGSSWGETREVPAWKSMHSCAMSPYLTLLKTHLCSRPLRHQTPQ